jgi:long-chain acyl-CoA synthetase
MDERPWLKLYGDRPSSVQTAGATGLEIARRACERRADTPLILYFTASITGARVAAESDALAAALADRGVSLGDRVALYLQNVPQMAIAVLAIWKLGAIVVTVNPMLREREVSGILADCGARVLICLEGLHGSVARHVVPGSEVQHVITTSPLDYLDDVPAVLASVERVGSSDTEDLGELIRAYAAAPAPVVGVSEDDVALLVYTSGTTGPPKGAMNLHRNVAFASSTFSRWPELTPADVNLVLAPMFHITGLIGGLGASLAAAAPMVLGYRFDPAATLDLIARYRPTFTVAAITAFSALMQAPGFAQADFTCLRAAFTGGAPVAPAVARAWVDATGVRLHSAYGLTETTSPLTLVPLGRDAPIDPATGTMSVGVPVFDSVVRVIDDTGSPVPPGDLGELVAEGPQVVPGYWGRPEETAHALPDGRLRTGDVGYIDGDGWVYLVDRLKDLIIASGYKIWPREVEDVLYSHPAVREAAVVGVPDSYRGETVKAYVSLVPGAEAGADELIDYCRERMAAYKYPRVVEIVDEMPKTASGKILRRALRDAADRTPKR